MNNVNGVHPAMAPKAVEPVAPSAALNPATQPQNISDTVEISDVAKLAAKIQDIPDVRTELVQRVKAELAAGTYETPEKIDIAAERLMDEFLTDV